MTLPDGNVWLALALSKHSHHQAARAWLETETRQGSILFCRATQQTLVRLLTTAAVLAPYGNPPLSNRAAWDVYQALAGDRRMAFAQEPAGLEGIWTRLALREVASAKLWMDSYLAAFAIGGAQRFVTFDSGFKQFSGLDLLLLEP
ncbi:MAG TPA: TA system VapC family ribonuclease toxin [Solimonas sp.]|nr:TA system VapC family ribonuclease toxin [Solimonas sp.]